MCGSVQYGKKEKFWFFSYSCTMWTVLRTVHIMHIPAYSLQYLGSTVQCTVHVHTYIRMFVGVPMHRKGKIMIKW